MSKASVLHAQRLQKTIWLIVAMLFVSVSGVNIAWADKEEKSWQDLRKSLFGDRPIAQSKELLTLKAPYRAEDPALVPIELGNLRGAPSNPIKTLTLIVDENPAPVAAVLTFAPDARVNNLETRIRVNAYSYVRAIAERQDGSLHMVKSYVKATGGCAAPASKNPDEALASLGQMRLRQYGGNASSNEGTEVQLQIRHPNYSGLQMNQVTGLYRSAHFVHSIDITADGKPVMSAEGAISLSENPSLRFRFDPQGAKTIAAHIEDTEGNAFDQSWQIQEKAAGKDS